MNVKAPVFLASLALAAGLNSASLFVSPAGNDGSPGTLARPFKTLSRALAGAQAGDTVILRGGLYRETLRAVRSGTADRPIVVRSYKDEPVVLAGSEPVTGAWTRRRGSIWSADGLPPTDDVFVDGLEMPQARWPHAPAGGPMTSGWAAAGAGTDASVLADPSLPRLDLRGMRAHIVAGKGWTSFTPSIASSGPGRARFVHAVGPNAFYHPQAGNRYFLYGSLALLGAPGEWFYDARIARLYLWCPDGGDPARHLVEVARRKDVASVAGCSYIQLRDFYTFCGGIRIAGCTGCVVDKVRQRYVQHFSGVDGFRTEAAQNALLGGRNCLWADGSIEGSSGDGLYVSGEGHRVHGMLIHAVCQGATYRAAIDLEGKGHRIDHNTCYDSGRYLILLGAAKGGAVEDNYLFDGGLLTRDSGAIYSFGSDGGGMRIARNRIRDMDGPLDAGIYLDNGDRNYAVEANAVERCGGAALRINVPCSGIRVTGNALWASGRAIGTWGGATTEAQVSFEGNLCDGPNPFVRDARRAPVPGPERFLARIPRGAGCGPQRSGFPYPFSGLRGPKRGGSAPPEGRRVGLKAPGPGAVRLKEERC